MIFVKVLSQRLAILGGMARRFSLFIMCGAVTFLCLQLAAGTAFAASTIDCHCFRDRNFSQENPSAFDPYLLATVQNRLLAYTFGISRKEIVQEKMSGAAGEQLWIMHWIARASGKTKLEIAGAWQQLGSWSAVVSEVKADPELLGHQFMKALTGGDQDSLALITVMQVFESFFAISPRDHQLLLQAGASLKELILSTVLAQMNHGQATALFKKARGNGNWGSVTILAGTSVEDLDAFLARHFAKIRS